VGGGWHSAAVRRVARLGLPLISQFFEADAIVASKVRLYREAAPPGASGLATVPVIRDVLVGDPAVLAKVLVPVYRRYAEWGMPLLGRPTRPEEIGPEEALRIAIVGGPSEVAERLRALEAAGATDLLARADLPGAPRAVVESTLEALAGLRGAACSRVESA
jgi:alkanesulfonate monooxygenase SsuD/methylene tetrahydromethanopterin reductase-like flavin-dependent oxidoreductase (luciferase family)